MVRIRVRVWDGDTSRVRGGVGRVRVNVGAGMEVRG